MATTEQLHEWDQALKKAQEALPGLEHDFSKLTTQLQEVTIKLEKCKADVAYYSGRLGL